KRCAQLMPDLDSISNAKFRIFANLRSFGSRAGRPDSVIKGLCRNHGAFHAVLAKRLLDLTDNLPLCRLPEHLPWDHVSIVRRPILNADLRVLSDDILEPDRRSSGRVKERLSLIGCRPLRPGKKVFSPGFRCERSAARLHQPRYKSLLLLMWNRFHFDL